MTKGEGNAVLLLLFCTLLITFWPYKPPAESPTDFSRLTAMADSLGKKIHKDSEKTKSFKLYSFNPNLATAAQLVELGFSHYLAKRIIAYRTKVRSFEFKSDLYKIYGVDSSLVTKLYPYIALPVRQANPANVAVANSTWDRPPQKPPVELNSADTLQLKNLPCIGAKLANRITAFREKLGGFVSKNQLKEVYGLDTNCLEDIYAATSLNINSVRKIKINSATVEELALHPYIGKYLANGLVAYRLQHGSFKRDEDLKSLKSLTPEKCRKLLPYLIFD